MEFNNIEKLETIYTKEGSIMNFFFVKDGNGMIQDYKEVLHMCIAFDMEFIKVSFCSFSI